MPDFKKTIQDIAKRPHIRGIKVDFHNYLSSKKEPSETISEMSPPHVDMQLAPGESTLKQREGLRKLASRVRLRKKTAKPYGD
jgi:hypothetical protein